MTYAISCSYGNDSCATIQHAWESGLDLVCDVYVVFIDTGWGSEDWPARVSKLEQWVTSLGFVPVRIRPREQFEDLMVRKKGFPNQRYQWCSMNLKTLPFAEWIQGVDPDGQATVIIGKRREESADRADTLEYVRESEYHGNRTVWHSICELVERERFVIAPCGCRTVTTPQPRVCTVRERQPRRSVVAHGTRNSAGRRFRGRSGQHHV